MRDPLDYSTDPNGPKRTSQQLKTNPWNRDIKGLGVAFAEPTRYRCRFTRHVQWLGEAGKSQPEI